jgi:DNA-binding transcriptional LysR family regulator
VLGSRRRAEEIRLVVPGDRGRACGRYGAGVLNAPSARSFRQLDLNLLVALDALLSEASVTRAGEKVGLSQSAMSGSLARLRSFFGDQLLARSGRDYRLTPKAQELVGPVREILARIDATLSSRTEFDPGSSDREFSIAASDYIAVVLLNRLIQELSHVGPSLRLHIRPLARMREQLHPGGADLVIEPRGFYSGYPSRIILRDRWVLVTDPDNAAVGDTVTPEQFEQLSFIAYALGGTGRSLAETQLEGLGVQMHSDVLVENFTTACLLVAGTRRVTIVQRRLAEQVRRLTPLRIVELPYELPLLNEALYWNPVNADEPGHVWIRGFVAEVAETV